MVVLGKAGEREEKLMAMAPERSKPLHNFEMPCLKWGNQRFLRCMKVNPNGRPSAAFTDRRYSASEVDNRLIGRKRRESESERTGWIDLTEQKKRFRNSPSPSPAVGGGGSVRKLKVGGVGDGGIEAVREKLMLDLQTETDKMRVAIMRERLEEEEEPPAAASEDAEPARPWNLRARRAAGKVLDVMNGASGGGGKRLKVDGGRIPNFSPARTESKSPRLRGDVATALPEAPSGEKTERPEFSVSLRRREIEEDFMVMVGHRPPRRPKKRPKIVQKELDCLFPGLWLTEVTSDLYKVADDPETGKS